jgi:hypothetical protein
VISIISHQKNRFGNLDIKMEMEGIERVFSVTFNGKSITHVRSEPTKTEEEQIGTKDVDDPVVIPIIKQRTKDRKIVEYFRSMIETELIEYFAGGTIHD